MKKRKSWIEDCIESLVRHRKNNEDKFIKSIKRSSFKKYLQYSKNAFLRKKCFYLTESDFINLEKSTCYYCGGKATGFDRLNSSIGYTRVNTVPCCSVCNMMKYTYAEKDFLNQIAKIYEYRINKIN